MSGHLLETDDWGDVSDVCTHPSASGRMRAEHGHELERHGTATIPWTLPSHEQGE